MVFTKNKISFVFKNDSYSKFNFKPFTVTAKMMRYAMLAMSNLPFVAFNAHS